jgi:hypothetical protein
MAAGVSLHPTVSSNSIEDISPKNAGPREAGSKWNSTENAPDSFWDTNLPSAADRKPFLEFLSACGDVTPTHGLPPSQAQTHAATPDLPVTDRPTNPGVAPQPIARVAKFGINFDLHLQAQAENKKALPAADIAESTLILGPAVSHPDRALVFDRAVKESKKLNKDCLLAVADLAQNLVNVSERAADVAPTGLAAAALSARTIPAGLTPPGSQLVAQMATPADARAVSEDTTVLEGSLHPISAVLSSNAEISASRFPSCELDKTSDSSNTQLLNQREVADQSSHSFIALQTRSGNNSALPKELEENSLRPKSASSLIETPFRPASQEKGGIESFARIMTTPVSIAPANATGDSLAVPAKIFSSTKPSLPMVDQSLSPATPAKTDFNVRLTGEAGDSVNIRVYEKAGEVQLSVRSSDPSVASHLRHELPAIHATLENAGWRLDSANANMETNRQMRDQPQHSHDERRDQHSSLDWEQQSNKKKNTLDLGWSELLDKQS